LLKCPNYSCNKSNLACTWLVADFKVYFSKSKVRDKLYLAIIAQARLVGNNIVEKEGVFNSSRSGRALSTESAAVEDNYDETSEKNEASEREEYTAIGKAFFDRMFKQVRDKVQISIQCEKWNKSADNVTAPE
jgi:hypothetical protein